jgi:putative membrane protein
MMMTGYGMDFGNYIWMIIFWIAVLGGGIWLLATIFPQTNTASDSNAEKSANPLAVLKQRYAHGEMSKEEFEAIRHDLEQA